MRSSRRNPLVTIAGFLLCALGFALAIWARMHLGRNWGMPMSLKTAPELVTSGPYRVIRHPIYAGLLLAMLGSACVGGGPWLLFFIVFCVYFVNSAKAEERLMVQQFPAQYPAYQRRTKALIPFIY
jgi:protein-S-isoprenylcysteine O-methyltransferase Ste14